MALRRGSRLPGRGATGCRPARIAVILSLAAMSLTLDTGSAAAAGGARSMAGLPSAPPVSAAARAAHDADVAVARALESKRAVDGAGAGPAPAVVDGRVAAFQPPPPPNAAAPAAPSQAAPPAVRPLVTEDRGPTARPGQSRVEVAAERDEHRMVFDNPDGTRTIETTSMPVNYQDEKGGWRSIDNRLVRDGSGALINAANDWRVRFRPMTAGGVEFTAPDGAVSFAARGAAGVAPVIEPDGESVRYVDVYPNTDLVYRVTGAGVEELIVLKNRNARATVDFEVSGATVTDDGAGGLDLNGASGLARRLQLSPVLTFDAKGTSVDPDNQVVDATTDGAGASVVTVGLDSTWVRAQPADSFPVVVDPSFSIPGTTAVTAYLNNIVSGNNINTVSDGYGYVGNPAIASSPNARWRSLVALPYNNYIGANVVSASLTTSLTAGASNTGTQVFRAYWAAEAGFHATTQPNYYVGYAPWRGAAVSNVDGWYAPIVDATQSTGSQAYIGNLTHLYNGWLRDGRPNGALLLVGNDGFNIGYTLKKFAVTISITINRWPSAPTGQIGSTPSPTNRRLHFGVQNPGSDPDGDAVVYNHWMSGPSGLLFQTGWVSARTADYQVPQSTYGQSLHYGTDYWDQQCLHGECHTGAAFSAAWTPVNVAPPEAKTGAAPDGVVVANTTPTLSVNAVSDANTDPVQYFFRACPTTTWDASCADSGWRGTTSWTVSPNKLYWGQPNYWWVFTSDGVVQTNPTVTHWVIPSVTPAADPNVGMGWNPFSTSAHGVDPTNGNFRHSTTDVSVKAIGAGLSITRAYNSRSTAVSAFGKGWTFPLDVSVSATAAGAMVTAPDGSKQFFGQNPNATFGRVLGSSNMLVKNPTAGVTWRLTDASKTYYDFDAGGRLIAAVSLNGTRIESSWPNATTQVFRETVSGRSLTLAYTTPAGATRPHVATVSTVSVTANGGPLVWTYAYSGDRLDRACDPTSTDATTCHRYTYDASGRLSKVVKPRGNDGAELGYDAQGRASWHEDGLNQRTTFAYSTVSVTPPGASPVSLTRVVITDPRGNSFAYDSDDHRRIRHRDDLASGQRWYEFDANGYVSAVTNELGQTERLVNDARGNVLQRTDQANKVWKSAYDANDRLLWSETPLGPTTRTTYVHDSVSGNPLSQTDPLGNRREWVYTNGTEPAAFGGLTPKGLLLRSADARGNVTRYEYNSAGSLFAMSDPTGLAVFHGPDELGRETVQKQMWGSEITQLDTTYDALSRVRTVTTPAVRNEVTAVDHQSRTTNTYDRNGNLVQTRVQDLIGGDAERVTSFEYDNNDRLWRTTDAEGGVTSLQFDANGNPTRTTDALGRVTRTDYDRSNRPTTVTLLGFTDPANPTSPARDVVLSRATYDKLDRLATTTDAAGTVAGYAYDPRGGLTSRTVLGFSPLSGAPYDFVTEKLTYDDANRVVHRESGNGQQLVDYTYDNASRVVVEYHENGVIGGVTVPPKGIGYLLDPNGNPTSTMVGDGVNPIFMETRTEFDGMNRVVSETVENGATDLVTRTTRDHAGHVVAVTDPRGHTTTIDYDVLGRPVRTLAPQVVVETYGAGAAADRPETVTGYDTFGAVRDTKDAASATTTTSYDRLGRRVGVAHPSYDPPGSPAPISPTEAFSYDPVGNLTAAVDRRGQTTNLGYDALNRPVSRTNPAATTGAARGVETKRYNDASQLVWQQNEIGAVTEASYDMLGRPRTSTAKVRGGSGVDSFTTTLDHDGAGNVISTRTPTGDVTTSVYARTGERLKTTDALGNVTAFGYDLSERLTRMTDPAGRTTRMAYDQAGRLLETARHSAAGAKLAWESYAYDLSGNRTAETTASGTQTGYAYDPLDRLTAVTQPVGGGAPDIVTSYGYDARGLQTRMTDGRAADWSTTYNAWGLAESRIEPSTASHPAAADRTFTFSYDAGGLPIVEEQPGSALVTRGYDNLGRLLTESGGTMGGSRGFEYDLAGRTTGATTPDTSLQFAFDDRDLLTSATGTAGQSSFGYDAAGRMIQRVDAAGTTNYSWTARNELAGLTEQLTGQARAYTWSAAGDLTTVGYGNGTTRAYTYDPIGRLDTDQVTSTAGTLWSADYDYNPDGNVATKVVGPAGRPGAGTNTYSYDKANRLVGWTGPGSATGGTSYAYDPNGNRVGAAGVPATYDQRNRLMTSGTTTNTWTARGDLAAATTNGTTTAYTYDGLGNTTAAGNVSYRLDALGRTVTRGGVGLAYSGTEQQPVHDGTTKIVHSPTGDPVVTNGGGLSLHLIADRHGDIVAATFVNGQIVHGNTYDPFGKPIAGLGASAIPIGFQGQYTDPGTGQVDMGARYYEPATGTFTTRDTDDGSAQNPVTTNRYAYANNNPLANTDPDGHKAVPVRHFSKRQGGGGKSFGSSTAKTWGSSSTKSNSSSPWRGASRGASPSSTKKLNSPPPRTSQKTYGAGNSSLRRNSASKAVPVVWAPATAPARSFALLNGASPQATLKSSVHVKEAAGSKVLADPGNLTKSWDSSIKSPPLSGPQTVNASRGKVSATKGFAGNDGDEIFPTPDPDFVIDMMAAVPDALDEPLGASVRGYCGSGNFGVLTATACVMSGPKSAGFAYSQGSSFGLSATVGYAISNVDDLSDFRGPTGCIAVSVGVAGGSVCGGINPDGSFNGVVVVVSEIQLDVPFEEIRLFTGSPVTVSVSTTYTAELSFDDMADVLLAMTGLPIDELQAAADWVFGDLLGADEPQMAPGICDVAPRPDSCSDVGNVV